MIEARFPTNVSDGAVGGDTFFTQKNILPNGKQQRSALQSKTLQRWTMNYRTQIEANHIILRNFILAVKGGFTAFRFRWLGDYKSDIQQDCSPAVGTGVLLIFQLQKTYTATAGATAYVRTITKPVSGTVSVYVGGVLKVNPTHYSFSTSTGVITFTGGNAPGNGVTVKATYEFDLPAILSNDENPYEVVQDNGTNGVYDYNGIEVEEVDEI